MKPSDPRTILAASYKRLAKTLRVRSRNHLNAAKRLKSFPQTAEALRLRAEAANDLADDFEHEARLLRTK